MNIHPALVSLLPWLVATCSAVVCAQELPDNQQPLGPPAVHQDPYFQPPPARSTSYMPRVIIRNIREDRTGKIWFTTFGGPICYDGHAFTNYAAEVGLANTRIFSLLEDHSSAIWFGSLAGVAHWADGAAAIGEGRRALRGGRPHAHAVLLQIDALSHIVGRVLDGELDGAREPVVG